MPCWSVCLSHVHTAMCIKNKEPVIQNRHHMYRAKLTQALPVSPIYSSSIPPSHHRERLRLSQHPPFGMTVQSQELDSGQKTMPGLLPGAFGDQWRELGLFTSTSFTFTIIAPAQSELCVFGAEANSCLKLSHLYSFRPCYNSVFSVVYTVSELFQHCSTV